MENHPGPALLRPAGRRNGARATKNYRAGGNTKVVATAQVFGHSMRLGAVADAPVRAPVPATNRRIACYSRCAAFSRHLVGFEIHIRRLPMSHEHCCTRLIDNPAGDQRPKPWTTRQQQSSPGFMLSFPGDLLLESACEESTVFPCFFRSFWLGPFFCRCAHMLTAWCLGSMKPRLPRSPPIRH